MICPHCNKNIPEGLIMCFHCGEPLESPAVPVQPEYSAAPEPVQAPYPVQAPPPLQPPPPLQAPVHAEQSGGKKKGLTGIIAAAVVVLLIGGTVGGHFLGFYTLPLLPEIGGTETPPITGIPDTSPENEQPATMGTPDDPSANGMDDSENQTPVLPEDQTLDTYNTSNFHIINVPPGYMAEVTTQSLEVSIRGSASDLARITDANIRVVADLSNISLGASYVNAQIYVDGFNAGTFGVVGEYSIRVNIIPETETASITLNMDLLRLLGQSNAYLRQLNGDSGSMALWYGSPLIVYSEPHVSYPVAFELAGDPGAADETWSRIIDGSLLSYYNNWPDDFIINMIYVWEGPYIRNLHHLFNTQLPLTLDNMIANFELEGEVDFIPVHEQGGNLDFGFDVWRCVFISGEYRIMAFFSILNEEIMLFDAGICLQN